MIKTYILEDLDCAHCAGKIEESVAKLDGVKKSTCTLLTQKLVVDIEDDKAAGLTAASGEPNKKKVATITRAQAEEIAKIKMPDLNAANLESATEMIKGTARSMGIVVED